MCRGEGIQVNSSDEAKGQTVMGREALWEAVARPTIHALHAFTLERSRGS